MISNFKQWLAPPVFPGDASKTRRAEILNVALLTVMGLSISIFTGNLAGGQTPIYLSLLNVMQLTLCLLLRQWMFQGKVTPTALVIGTLGFIGITEAGAILGTIRTPTTSLYLVLVVSAGLLFELRGIIVSTLVSSLAVLGLIIAENAGWLPQPDYRVSLTQWITFTAIFGLIGAMTIVSFHATRKALRRVDQELEKRIRLELELHDSESVYHSLVETMPLSVCRKDLEGRFVFANSRFCAGFNKTPADIIGKTDLDLHPPELAHKYREDDLRVMRSGNTLDQIETHQPVGGEIISVQVIKTPLRNDRNEITGIQIIFWDVTQRMRAEERLRYLGTHDVLTGLYNRTFYEAELERLAKSRLYPLSLILIDVDGLKQVNDTLGHAAGDELLRHAAEIVRTAFREEEIIVRIAKELPSGGVARIGGDEFAILLPEMDAATAGRAVERVRQVMHTYNQSAPHPLSLSLGAATADKQGIPLQKVQQEADAAMYRDKMSKRSRPGHIVM